MGDDIFDEVDEVDKVVDVLSELEWWRDLRLKMLKEGMLLLCDF